MPRPKCCRRVAGMPRCKVFKPAGVPACSLQEVVLTVDELEAVRLADLQGLYQEQAAEQMNISRQTFGRIIESAHRKVAETLVEGKALRIEGGEIECRAPGGRGPGGRGCGGRGRCRRRNAGPSESPAEPKA